MGHLHGVLGASLSSLLGSDDILGGLKGGWGGPPHDFGSFWGALLIFGVTCTFSFGVSTAFWGFQRLFETSRAGGSRILRFFFFFGVRVGGGGVPPSSRPTFWGPPGELVG